MDDATKARWHQVGEAYAAARKIALHVWPEDTPPEVLQAATATLLIEFGRHRPLAPVPGSGAPPVREADPVAAMLGAAPSACPQCGGPLYDNRADKAAGALPARRPDFKCKDDACGWVQWPPRRTPSPSRRKS
jgi:hypothetical protein